MTDEYKNLTRDELVERFRRGDKKAQKEYRKRDRKNARFAKKLGFT
jgi:hypothetical protein